MESRFLYEFVFESTPDIINFTGKPLKNYTKVLFYDSLFEFFPTLEVNFTDPHGVIPDQTNFIQDLEFKAKLGNAQDGYIGGQYIWFQHEFNDVTIEEFFSGSNIFLLSHALVDKEKEQNRSWNDTIKNVITDIATNDYSIPVVDQKISNTTGMDYWYQSGIKNSLWIQELSDISYDASRPKKPYYAFINLLNEFYFMSLSDLFLQEPVNLGDPYVIDQSQSGIDSPYSIKDYLIQNGGMDINFNLYQLKNYHTTSSGSSSSEIFKIQDFLYSNGIDKLLLRSAYDRPGTINYTNIIETTQDKYNKQGLINSIYRDSALSYRMGITIPFNPKVASGKIIELKTSSAFESKAMAKEYSGKWLVLNSMHHINDDGIVFSRLTLAKSTMYVDNIHPLKNDFTTVA